MITLPTDIYYRGYRLSRSGDGNTYIYWDAELVDTVSDRKVARETIDDWLNAK